MNATGGARQRPEDSGRLQVILLVALIAAVALVVWVVALRGDGEGGAEAGESAVGPVAMSAQELADFAAEQDHPVYWAGEQPDAAYELTRTETGNVFVRYLDSEDEVGETRPTFLIVGTYPVESAHDLVVAAAEEDGAITDESPDGMLVVSNEAVPTSVYLSSPGSEVQIEVYDPDPERAMEVATSGDVQPIR